MKNIPLSSDILDSMSNISTFEYDISDDAAPKDIAQEQGENSQYVRISLFSDDEDEKNSLYVSKSVQRPTIYRIKDARSLNEISNQSTTPYRTLEFIKNHVLKYGTIDEIRLVGHGAEGMLGEGGCISISHFMTELESLQNELNIKIVKRIIFDGCNTFSKLKDSEIKNYSDYAKRHQVQIVGATSTTAEIDILGNNLHVRCGRYVQFSPHGRIIRDDLDTRYNPYMLSMSNDVSWTDFYIGHTQEEGLRYKQIYESKKDHMLKSVLRHSELGKYAPKY